MGLKKGVKTAEGVEINQKKVERVEEGILN